MLNAMEGTKHNAINIVTTEQLLDFPDFSLSL